MRGDGWQLSGLRRRFWTGAHRALCERPAAVRELVRPRPAVRALEQTALVAQHFARAEIRSPPRGGVGGATIVAPTSDPVAKLRRCIIRVSNGIMVLARKGVRQRS